MAHDLAEYEGGYAFAANVTRGHPWHRLGVQVTADMDIDTAIKQSWSNDWVYPVTLQDSDNDEAEGFIGIKSDIWGIMHVAKPGYDIMQRKEILELAYEVIGLAKGDAVIDTIGNLDGGRQFFTYLRLPELVIDPNGVADVIERGMLVATSFNATLPHIIGDCSIRAVCKNTLYVGLKKGMSRLIKVKHTRFAEQRIRMAAEGLEYAGAMEAVFKERAEAMLQVDGSKALNAVLENFWPLEDKLTQSGLTRRENERETFVNLYQGPGNLSADLVGKNGWGVYQAFTEYLDHERVVKGNNVKGASADVVRATAAVLPNRIVDQKVEASDLILAVGA